MCCLIRVRLELTAMCVFVPQTLTDWRDGSQDSIDASDAGRARPKVMQHTRNTTQMYLFIFRNESFLCFRTLRMLRENLEEEAVIMKDVPGWKVKINSSQSQQALTSSWSIILNGKLSYCCRSFYWSNFSPHRSVKVSFTQTAGWPPCQRSCSTSGPVKKWWTSDSASCATSECCRISFHHSPSCELSI